MTTAAKAIGAPVNFEVNAYHLSRKKQTAFIEATINVTTFKRSK